MMHARIVMKVAAREKGEPRLVKKRKCNGHQEIEQKFTATVQSQSIALVREPNRPFLHALLLPNAP